jgi:hypothetical protein
LCFFSCLDEGAGEFGLFDGKRLFSALPAPNARYGGGDSGLNLADIVALSERMTNLIGQRSVSMGRHLTDQIHRSY